MRPGPDQTIACPKCKGLAKYMTLMSGNTLGARVWTDGKQVAPMLPRPPAVVKCRHCGECYWLAKAERVGNVNLLQAAWSWCRARLRAMKPRSSKGQQVHPTLAAASKVQEPTEEEYYLALEKGLAADRKQERNLRVFAWWRRNDALREASYAQAGGTATVSVGCKKNLEALRCLLNDADDSDRIMKAEIHRELGEFEYAKEVLKSVTSSKYSIVVRQLWSMCEKKDTCVKELELGA